MLPSLSKKTHVAPLSSAYVKCYLIKEERPSLSLHLFYEPRLRYTANQSGSAKDTVSLKIGKDIEMLVCFICMEIQDRTLNHQITMNQHKN